MPSPDRADNVAQAFSRGGSCSADRPKVVRIHHPLEHSAWIQLFRPEWATHEDWARYIAAGMSVIDTSTGHQADLQLWKLVPIDSR